MIGEWIARNPGETLGIGTAVVSGAGWLLVRWLGDKFEPKRPTLTPEQQRLAIEEKARAVLSTEQIGRFAEATVQTAYQSADFWDNVEKVAIRSKAVQEFVDGRCKHAFTSHESAIRIIMADATKAVGDQLQKSLSDSQAMFMAELRGIRSDLAEGIERLGERVSEIDTALKVHEAKDQSKRPG